MKWVNRANLKEVNEAFIDCLKVQYGDNWDMAYLRQDTVFAVGGKNGKYIGFPESMDETNALKAMSKEELTTFIPPDLAE